MPAADLVISGTVLTVDEPAPTAEALAVTDGRITAVGSRSEIENLVGPATRTLDLGGGCARRADPRHPGSQGGELRP